MKEDGTLLTGRAVQRHRLALLALLARSPGAMVSRDVLMAHLWPESDADQARNLLKVSVYVLRQALDNDVIVSAGDGIRLALDVCAVDTHEFEEALGRAEHERAVELYRGPFLDGLFLKEAPEFGHWMDRERARLADAYAGALEALASAAEARGDRPGAISWWKRRAAHDPYDSRVALRLMQALVAAGSRAGALQQAAVHARLLEGELGLNPSPEVQAFVERLRAGTEGAPESVVPEGAPPDRVASPPETVPNPEPSRPSSQVVQHAPRPPAPTHRVGRSYLVAGSALAGVAAVALLLGRSPRDRATEPDAAAERIARAVVREMAAMPAAASVADSAPPATSNVAAWELYRRASQPEVLRSDSAAREALGLATRAVELDPTFAGAHAALARLYVRVAPPSPRNMPRAEALRLAEQHAARAIALDESLAEAHATLGIASMSLYAFDEAERHLRRATELDPRGSEAREWLVQLYVGMGRFSDALTEAEQALEANPLSASARGELARALLVNARCDDALQALQPLESLEPTLLRAGMIAAQCHAQMGMWEEAIDDVLRGQPRSGNHGKAALAFVLARGGRRDEALVYLDELIEAHRSTGEGSFWVAMAYAGLGDLDQAFEWLFRGADDYSMNYEVREPWFAELQSDPRFADVLGRLDGR